MQAYIYIYGLHLALTPEHLLSTTCSFQNKLVSLHLKVTQADNGQSRTKKRLKIVTVSLPYWSIEQEVAKIQAVRVIGSKPCLSANKKCKSSICEVYTFFISRIRISICFIGASNNWSVVQVYIHKMVPINIILIQNSLVSNKNGLVKKLIK